MDPVLAAAEQYGSYRASGGYHALVLAGRSFDRLCQTNRIFHADEVEVETGGLGMITFKNGVFATIDAGWSRPPYWPTWGGSDL